MTLVGLLETVLSVSLFSVVETLDEDDFFDTGIFGLEYIFDDVVLGTLSPASYFFNLDEELFRCNGGFFCVFDSDIEFFF